MEGNGAYYETEPRGELLAEAADRLRHLLPDGWEVTVSAERSGSASPVHPMWDALLRVSAPDGRAVTLATEVRTGRAGATNQIVTQLLRHGVETGRQAILVASYVGPAIRKQCEDNGVAYIDLTGWCRLDTSSPAIVIRSVGAGRDPRPPRSAVIVRLSGAGAGRVVRSLLDGDLPAGVREIAQRAGVSPGTVSKVLKALASEAIVARDASGRIEAVQKRYLVDRWTRDYSFLKTNTVEWYLAPRGIADAIKKLAGIGRAVATGSLAAQTRLPKSVMPVTAISQVALYVPRIRETAHDLELIPADRASSNVLLARPYDVQLLVVQPRPDLRIPTVDHGQTVADLKTMPGRAPQEADQLMDYLATTDDGWR